MAESIEGRLLVAIAGLVGFVHEIGRYTDDEVLIEAVRQKAQAYAIEGDAAAKEFMRHITDRNNQDVPISMFCHEQAMSVREFGKWWAQQNASAPENFPAQMQRQEWFEHLCSFIEQRRR